MVESEFRELLAQGRIHFGKDSSSQPNVIRYLYEIEGFVPWTWWPSDEAGHTDEAKKELYEILGREVAFDNPKPTRLIRRLLGIATSKDSLVLDSFAGSGTTAQSVLALNKEDQGHRRFILVETENYADTISAERIRRVIRGVKESKDETLQKGLGGSFTFCKLGEPIDLDRFFDGKGAPVYEQVARYIVYTATGQSADAPAEPRKDWFVAESGGYRIHVIYKPDLAFMRSNDSALTLDIAKQIEKSAKGKPVLVYAAAKFMSQGELTRRGITFCQLPYSVHRVLGEAPDAT
jgi:adenine-specific DNA-methyltransferase